ncbi:MAG: hypothetical protein IPO62_12980 [Saprospiraceae bacterium]|nr:hypothetical protein [Saprospiraceae bacterium]
MVRKLKQVKGKSDQFIKLHLPLVELVKQVGLMRSTQSKIQRNIWITSLPIPDESSS